MDPQKLLKWTDATQLKSFDIKLALKAEQDKAFVLNNAMEAAKADEASSFQSTLNQAKWKQARAACMQRLRAQRAQLPVASAIVKVYPAKNKRGGAGTCHICKDCGEPRKGSHGRSGCPSMK